jgi:3'(2'), 5'-bisphosphate nucleotidase
MTLYIKERKMAVDAVIRASRVCQDIRASLVDEETVIKEDRSPVTIADFSAQSIIAHCLLKEFPDDPLVAEESAADFLSLGDKQLNQRVFESVRSEFPDLDNNAILQALDHGNHDGKEQKRFWTLDPIDGTKGFLRNQQYAVSFALIEDGEVVFGVLGCPNYPVVWSDADGAKGILLIAAKGEGTVMRTMDDDTEHPAAVSDINDASQAVFCESVEAGHSSHSNSQKISDMLGVTKEPIRLDSQCKYSAVALADASVYLRLPTSEKYKEKIWDHAAGVIALTEAGGRVSDIYGKELDFSQGSTLAKNKGVVATNGLIHNKVIVAVKTILGL